MKGLKVLLGISLAATGVTSAVALGVVSSNKANERVQLAEAETYSQGAVIANDKARIWIGYDNERPFYDSADANTGIRLWIHSTEDGQGGEALVYGTITGTFNNGAEFNRRYDYFDVDLSVYTNEWYMTVQKFQYNNWKAATNPIQLTATNAFKAYYIWGDWAWDQTAGTVSPGAITNVDAGMAAKALGGIHTCSSSAINGYNAFPNFNSTFVMNGESWKTTGNLSDYTIDDFADGDTSYSGSAATTTNAYDKYVAVQSLYNKANPSLSSRAIVAPEKHNATMGIVVGVSAAVIVSLGACYFILRKKHN